MFDNNIHIQILFLCLLTVRVWLTEKVYQPTFQSKFYIFFQEIISNLSLKRLIVVSHSCILDYQ